MSEYVYLNDTARSQVSRLPDNAYTYLLCGVVNLQYQCRSHHMLGSNICIWKVKETTYIVLHCLNIENPQNFEKSWLFLGTFTGQN